MPRRPREPRPFSGGRPGGPNRPALLLTAHTYRQHPYQRGPQNPYKRSGNRRNTGYGVSGTPWGRPVKGILKDPMGAPSGPASQRRVMFGGSVLQPIGRLVRSPTPHPYAPTHCPRRGTPPPGPDAVPVPAHTKAFSREEHQRYGVVHVSPFRWAQAPPPPIYNSSRTPPLSTSIFSHEGFPTVPRLTPMLLPDIQLYKPQFFMPLVQSPPVNPSPGIGGNQTAPQFMWNYWNESISTDQVQHPGLPLPLF